MAEPVEEIEDLVAEQLKFWADGFETCLDQINFGRTTMLAKVKLNEATTAAMNALRAYGLKKEEGPG